MTWNSLVLFVGCWLLANGTLLCAQGATASRPQVPRQGDNLVIDPAVASADRWSLLGDAVFDAETSRSEDGSGSFQLVTPIPLKSSVFSALIPVQKGRTYTFGFYLKTAGGPTYVGCQLNLYDGEKQSLRNLAGGRAGTAADGDWEEVAFTATIPDDVAFVKIQAFKNENTRPDGRAWVDDFYLGEGVGLEQPPATKQGFAGQHVRVDPLGNFEVNKDGTWTHFFPLCMYADNSRDWSLYSRQGWNTIIWTGSADQIQQAKAAVSDFNPDGMMAGFQIAQYTFPAGWAYNDLDDLRSKLREIFDRHLDDRLLLYYWDNENNHDQWQVPADVIETIRSIDVDAAGKRLHPVYALQGEFNVARVHAARGLVDVSGTYVNGEADTITPADDASLLLLDRLEGQVSPSAFAQFNGVTGAGDLRLRLYNSLLMGARAIGYWRDCPSPNCKSFAPGDGPVDEQHWWADVPNLRREVDQLLPLIREPHWTTWTAHVDDTNAVRIGTRDHDGQGYLFLVNQTSRPQTVNVTLDALPYKPSAVHSAFDDAQVAAVENGVFSLTLPSLGVNSGTAVLRLVSPTVRP